MMTRETAPGYVQWCIGVSERPEQTKTNSKHENSISKILKYDITHSILHI